MEENRADNQTPRRQQAQHPAHKKKKVGTAKTVIGTILAIGLTTCLMFFAIFMIYVHTSLDLDVDISAYTLKQSSTVYYQDKTSGEWVELTKLHGVENRTLVSIDEIPKHVQDALISIEDERFESHHGVDWKSTAKAIVGKLTGTSTRGGSTITQQVIKNTTGDNEVTIKRKVTEIFRALRLEKNYSKDEILETYFNKVYFGNGCYGIEAAAESYFGKTVGELTIAEAASIVGITQFPYKYDPARGDWYREQNKERQLTVLYKMHELGKISDKEYEQAKVEPLVFSWDPGFVPSAGVASRVDTASSTEYDSYFVERMFNDIVADMHEQLGYNEETAKDMLYTGGYTIEATVNPKIQTAMENLMLNTDDAYFPAGWHEEEVTSISDDDVQVFNEDGTPKTRTGDDGTVYYYRNVRTQAAMVTLDYDGNVLAMVGGLGEKTKSLSLNRAYSVTRQTGSTIKPIGAYALGVEYGLVNWSTMLNNSPLYQKQDMVIRDEDYCRKNGLMGLSDSQLKAYPNAWRSWPRNYGGNYGDGSDLPLWNGLARSLNTIAIRVGDLVGASNIFNFVYNTLQLTTLDPANDVGLAQMVMGSQTHGVTPTALAAAFQIFYDGEYTTPHLYTRVLDRDGNIYLENNATSYQALTPQTAYIMNRLLKNVLYSNVGTASGRYPNSNGMESFGKTGTASDEKDLWFVGGTPYYVTAVWWGYDAPYDMTNTLGKQQAKTRTCVMAWKAYMEQVQANLPYKAFPTSDGVVERAYCTQSGLLAGANCPSRATGYYRADDLPDTCNYSHSSGVAAAQSADTAPVVGQDTTGMDTD